MCSFCSHIACTSCLFIAAVMLLEVHEDRRPSIGDHIADNCHQYGCPSRSYPARQPAHWHWSVHQREHWTSVSTGVDSVFAIKLFIGIILQANCIKSMEYCVIVCHCVRHRKNSITASQSRETLANKTRGNYYFHFACTAQHKHTSTVGNFNCVHTMCGSGRCRCRQQRQINERERERKISNRQGRRCVRIKHPIKLKWAVDQQVLF